MPGHECLLFNITKMIFKNILGVSNLFLWWTLLLIVTAKDRPIQGIGGIR